MKKAVTMFLLIAIVATSFVSAGFLDTIWDSITGKVVHDESWCSLDVDEDGQVLASTDATYISRYLLGLSEIVPPTFRDIEPYLISDEQIIENIITINDSLDVDGDGQVLASTDATYISRYLLGLSEIVPPDFRNFDETIPLDETIAGKIETIRVVWSNGTCTNQEEVNTEDIIGEQEEYNDCYDTDRRSGLENGRDYYKPGSTVQYYEGEEVHYTDVCVKDIDLGDRRSKKIAEYYCEGSLVKLDESYECEHGCEKGACKEFPPIACEDRDGGINEYYLGGVTRSNGELTLDTCVDDTLLREGYCSDDEIPEVKTRIITCGNGCSGGVCIQKTCQTNADCNDNNFCTSEYCSEQGACVSSYLNDIGCETLEEQGYCSQGECRTDICLLDGDCDDGNECTEDFCAGGEGGTCENIVLTGVPCRDRNGICAESAECILVDNLKPEIRSLGLGTAREKSRDAYSNRYPVGENLRIHARILDVNKKGLQEVSAKIFEESVDIVKIPLRCKEFSGEEHTYICSAEWFANGVARDIPVEYTLEVNTVDNTNKQASKKGVYEIEFESIDFSLCKELIPGHNDLRARRANIVFVGLGYQGINERSAVEMFQAATKKVVDFDGTSDGLFSVTPFKENKNKFNMWYVDKLGTTRTGSCRMVDKGDLCSDSQNLQAHCVLPNKYIVIMANLESKSAAAGSTAYISAEIITPDSEQFNQRPHIQLEGTNGYIEWLKPRTFTHEFGHSFARLSDEYTYDVYGSSRSGRPTAKPIITNCWWGLDFTYEECMTSSPWVSMIGNGCGEEGVVDCTEDDPDYNLEIGCFEGCYVYTQGVFRSTRNSIMRAHYEDPFEFGLWNEELISHKINQFEE